MKTISTFLLLLVASIVHAYDFEVNGIYYNIKSLSELTAEVSHNGMNSYSGNVEIPNYVEYNGKNLKITGIGQKAFYYCENLESIKISEYIEEIGNSAIGACPKLTILNIPASVKTIGGGAASGCVGIKSLNVPSTVEIIGENAFSGCTGLETLTIENGVTTIGMSAFYGCTSLTSIIIPKSVLSVGTTAFRNCSNLKEVIIEDGDEILEVGNTQPWYNVKLQNIHIGRNIKRAKSNYYFSWSLKNAKKITVGKNVSDLWWLLPEDTEVFQLECETPPTARSFSNTEYVNASLIIPAGSKELYMQTEPWKNFWNVTEAGTTCIEDVKNIGSNNGDTYLINGIKGNKSVCGPQIMRSISGKNIKVIK